MVKKSLKFLILAYASGPDKNYKYEGDIVEYEGKRYFVSLAEERVEFLGLVGELNKQEQEIKDTMDFPEGVVVEPEYIVNEDGSIKLTGFGLVRRD